MTPASDNNTAPRPAAFDARIASYMPGLRRQAAYYCSQPADVEDLVQDTVEFALKTWRDFREGGALWWWLKRRMQHVVAMRKRHHSMQKRDGMSLPIERASSLAVAASQGDAVELSDALAAMNHRTREIMVRVGMGENGTEIGRDMGLCRERIRQIVRAERKAREAA